MSVATFISRQSPKFRRGLATNSTDPSFQASGGPVPQAAVPATVDSSTPTSNSIIQDLTGEFTQLSFFGTDADNEGATVKVVFWTEVQQRTDDTSALWVPYDQGTYEVFFSSTQNGIASSPVLDTEYVADTLTEKDTTWDDSMIEMIKNPGGDRMATVTLKNMGYQKIGVYFDKDSPTGGARQFTAANTEFLSATSNSELETGSTDFAFSAWVYPDSKSASMGIVSRYTGSTGTSEYFIELDTSLRVTIAMDGDSETIETGSGTLTEDAWNHVVVEHDDGTSLRITINGGSTQTISYTDGNTAEVDGVNFRVGIRTATASPMNGRMALLGYWKRLLTTAEISQLRNGGLGLSYGALDSGLRTSLISYWNLNEESGNAIDQHGSNDLTDNNTVTAAQGPGADSNNVNALIKCF